MSDVNDRLHEVFTRKGMSYGELANKTGLNRGTLQKYVTGVIEKIPIDRLKLIAKALGVSAAYLMGWEGNETEAAPNNGPDPADYDYAAHGAAVRYASPREPDLNVSPSAQAANIDAMIDQLNLLKRSQPMDKQEAQLLSIFRCLPPESRDAIMRVALAFEKDKKLL